MLAVLPRGIFLNWPRAMAFSMRSLARAARPWTVPGMGRAEGRNRSLSCFRRDSFSEAVRLGSWLMAYMEVRSRALARRRPWEDCCCRMAFRMRASRLRFAVAALDAAADEAEEEEVLRRGLWASLSMRKEASEMVSVPVHGCAAAVRRISLPAEGGREA